MRYLFMNLGPMELLLIFLVVLLLFGGSKLPELARGLGRAIRTFKEESEGVRRELEKAVESPPEPPPAATKPTTEISSPSPQPPSSPKKS
ncbi:MAG: twin-arginine translocase TatA/TatE family subunit [Candidatus Bipolaricaulota bacterium]|nr:twin-arginine translocase TatA/TatE family subunit [Candidatus Bipolaricaulota bacterium]MCS7275012.1 twin-arginine translocase TatA/TatE family subunit [Candidatus Bipolaricaulota bacterium]MDW8110523.1 twin-arginine translocase TatA/TatE family subunit [Candidatus Bipolaricaulota bacterium]MDW8329326.1 twin-arginine translocase TatA/TatE family subunit [Candidatus Bipolaricaulota bacterium]